MYRYIFIALLFAGSLLQAQTKKPAPKNKNIKAQADTIRQDTVVVEEEVQPLPQEFKVYTKRSKNKKERLKLCINLVNGDSILNYCMNDSVLRDPEVFKILFQEQSGDTSYVLVYASAFSKNPEKIACTAGKEVKLFFVRWNTVTNKAIVKPKYIESCMKAITNMTKEPVDNWDKQSVLTFNYHRGGTNFVELKFDPQNYKLGLQSANDAENKGENK